jgi:hypothetical protein
MTIMTREQLRRRYACDEAVLEAACQELGITTDKLTKAQLKKLDAHFNYVAPEAATSSSLETATDGGPSQELALLTRERRLAQAQGTAERAKQAAQQLLEAYEGVIDRAALADLRRLADTLEDVAQDGIDLVRGAISQAIVEHESRPRAEDNGHPFDAWVAGLLAGLPGCEEQPLLRGSDPAELIARSGESG